jgi:hypothetical protein
LKLTERHYGDYKKANKGGDWKSAKDLKDGFLIELGKKAITPDTVWLLLKKVLKESPPYKMFLLRCLSKNHKKDMYECFEGSRGLYKIINGVCRDAKTYSALADETGRRDGYVWLMSGKWRDGYLDDDTVGAVSEYLAAVEPTGGDLMADALGYGLRQQ